MKPKTLVLLAVAAGCGLVAMLGVQQAMQGQDGPAPVRTAKVLVALENIETGMRLTEDNVTFQEMPVDSVQDDAVRTEKEYADRAAKVPLMAGDIVRKSKLTEPGQFGKSVQIPVGMRVQTIKVDDTHTNSGLLRPGDRVDVHVTYQSRSDRGGAISKTKTLLEYVEVFASDDTTASKLNDSDESGKAKTVSLLLTPDQVNYVLLAQQKGVLSLSWRNRADDELAQTKEIDDKLLEELAGTVGGYGGFGGGMPLYQNGFGSDFKIEETPEPRKKSASAFLDSVQDPSTAALPPTVTPPSWTVQVFSGDSVVPHHFDLVEKGESSKDSVYSVREAETPAAPVETVAPQEELQLPQPGATPAPIELTETLPSAQQAAEMPPDMQATIQKAISEFLTR